MDTYKLLYGKDRRFGMFIHWGLYALTEYHEQAQSQCCALARNDHLF